MSYGTSLPDAYRQVGVYAGRILKGAKPADLPAVQSTKFDLLINPKKATTATIPVAFLAGGDAVRQGLVSARGQPDARELLRRRPYGKAACLHAGARRNACGSSLILPIRP